MVLFVSDRYFGSLKRVRVDKQCFLVSITEKKMVSNIKMSAYDLNGNGTGSTAVDFSRLRLECARGTVPTRQHRAPEDSWILKGNFIDRVSTFLFTVLKIALNAVVLPAVRQ